MIMYRSWTDARSTEATASALAADESAGARGWRLQYVGHSDDLHIVHTTVAFILSV